MEGGGGRGVGGGGGEGGGGGGVGICQGEGGGIGDLFGGGEGGDEDCLDWNIALDKDRILGFEGEVGIRTIWGSPGAVVEEGEIQVVIHTAVRSKHPNLWGNHIMGIRCARSQCQYMPSL